MSHVIRDGHWRFTIEHDPHNDGHRRSRVVLVGAMNLDHAIELVRAAFGRDVRIVCFAQSNEMILTCGTK